MLNLKGEYRAKLLKIEGVETIERIGIKREMISFILSNRVE